MTKFKSVFYLGELIMNIGNPTTRIKCVRLDIKNIKKDSLIIIPFIFYIYRCI